MAAFWRWESGREESVDGFIDDCLRVGRYLQSIHKSMTLWGMVNETALPEFAGRSQIGGLDADAAAVRADAGDNDPVERGSRHIHRRSATLVDFP